MIWQKYQKNTADQQVFLSGCKFPFLVDHQQLQHGSTHSTSAYRGKVIPVKLVVDLMSVRPSAMYIENTTDVNN